YTEQSHHLGVEIINTLKKSPEFSDYVMFELQFTGFQVLFLLVGLTMVMQAIDQVDREWFMIIIKVETL
ncbi:MAG TPA: hypothetical protein PK690_10815, partial [Emcibacteraceae bacterium]|nr:hypothetical protein [Emcibacteraceae bacterium]